MAKERMSVHISFSFEGASMDEIPDDWHVSCRACEDIADSPAYRPKSVTVTTSGSDSRDTIEAAILAAVNTALGTS